MTTTLNNIKITDGDLILITLDGENITTAYMDKIKARLEQWCTQRGLKDVTFMTIGGKFTASINKFTVNDVFEDAVLGDKK